MKNTPLTLRFALDSMLGHLARYLLHAGYDCFYRETIQDEQLANRARQSDRVLVTRDLDFVRKPAFRTEVFVIRDTTLRESLRCLREAYRLCFNPEFFFTRCSECNRRLNEVDQAEVAERIPEGTAEWIDRYFRCENCKKIYWKGSHHEDFVRKLREWNLMDDNPK